MTKVGMFFGCWDLFHDGHLTALLNASYKCDVLWIGVYSDNVIKSYKNHYPIVTQIDRMRLIRYLHLNCCQVVTPIEKRAPMDLSFVDILFLSEEWKNRDFPILNGNETFRGEIVYLPRTKGIDTTSIIEKCRKTRDTA